MKKLVLFVLVGFHCSLFFLCLFYVLLEYIESINMGVNREKDAQKDT